MRMCRFCLSCSLVLVACKSHHDEPRAATTVASGSGSSIASGSAPRADGVVPRASAPITIDGKWNDPDWNANSLQYKFRGLSGDDSDLARPYSEVRFVHDDTNLYVGLYASDNNVQSSDFFDLKIGPLAVQINPTGKITPETPDIQVGTDLDGTLDDPKDHDEEWKLEISIPLAKVGLAPGKTVDAHAGRCDVPLGGTKRCGEWTGQLKTE